MILPIDNDGSFTYNESIMTVQGRRPLEDFAAL